MMTPKNLEEFILFLKKKQWEVYGPVQQGEGLSISVEAIEEPVDLALGPALPFYSFKKFFIPEQECLFKYQAEKLKASPLLPLRRLAIFGINLLDLKAVLLYDQVFEKDPYYQARRRNLLIIGHSHAPDISQNIFGEKFEEDILEHLSFDIFLTTDNKQSSVSNEYGVFTGSLLGQKILDEFGYKEYINIQFSGPVREGQLDERMLKLKDKLENHHNQKIWDELGKRCIECGKCTIVCPTCFCFRIDDEAELGQSPAKRGDQASFYGLRERCWDTCFYQEFSEVAGPSLPAGGSGQAGHKFLNSTAQRLHFWYEHKFVRIPKEFDFMGCVGCRRCAAVCPVGIDIGEVLKEIEKS